MFAKLYRDARLEYLEFDVDLVPMLSPPRPWIKYDSGGMLITEGNFFKLFKIVKNNFLLIVLFHFFLLF